MVSISPWASFPPLSCPLARSVPSGPRCPLAAQWWRRRGSVRGTRPAGTLRWQPPALLEGEIQVLQVLHLRLHVLVGYRLCTNPRVRRRPQPHIARTWGGLGPRTASAWHQTGRNRCVFLNVNKYCHKMENQFWIINKEVYMEIRPVKWEVTRQMHWGIWAIVNWKQFPLLLASLRMPRNLSLDGTDFPVRSYLIKSSPLTHCQGPKFRGVDLRGVDVHGLKESSGCSPRSEKDKDYKPSVRKKICQ